MFWMLLTCLTSFALDTLSPANINNRDDATAVEEAIANHFLNLESFLIFIKYPISNDH